MKKVEDMFTSFDMIHKRDGQMERQTDIQTLHDSTGCTYAYDNQWAKEYKNADTNSTVLRIKSTVDKTSLSSVQLPEMPDSQKFKNHNRA